MNAALMLGIAALAVGAVLLGFAYHSTEAPVDQLSNALTGRYTDTTMWYIVTGAVVAVGGGLVIAFVKRG